MFTRFVAFIICLVWANGQLLAQARLLECAAPVPEEFRTLSSVKYADEQKRNGKRNKAATDEFLLASSFMVDQVLNSGRVLFNDPASLYLGEVLDQILINEPELRKKVRVYAMRSSVVNAFTTNNGIILVNLGLIAQLENEAQLAFVLCHELQHFTGGHVISSYLETQAMEEGRGNYGLFNMDDRLLAQSLYNKDLEMEADSLGLARLMATPYSNATVRLVFEVMRFAHLPYNDVAWPIGQFDEGHYFVDPAYALSKVRSISPLSDIDPASTHPGTLERMAKVAETMDSKTATGKSDFVVGRERFFEARQASRLELCALANADQDPVRAIYLSYLLELEKANPEFVSYQKAKALYSLVKYKNGGAFGSVHPGFSQIEGEIQQAYHFFYRLGADELNVLVVRQLHHLAMADKNGAIKAMYIDAVADLIKHHVPFVGIEREMPEAAKNGDPTNVNSRFDLMHLKSLDDPRKWMVQFGLVDLFHDPKFAQLYDSLVSVQAAKAPMVQNIVAEKRAARHMVHHGFAVGAQKAVCVSPEYMKLDMRKRQKNRFLSSEAARLDLHRRVNRAAKIAGVELEMLDVSGLGVNDVERFNDITFLNDWADARFAQTEVGMVNTEQPRLDTIIKRYGTEHFVWTGVINYRESKPLRYFYLFYLLMPPALPFALYSIVSPAYDTYYFFVEFNLRTGEPEMVAYSNFDQRDAADMIDSKVYDSFYQLRRTPTHTDKR